jgi:hypothetical protein
MLILESEREHFNKAILSKGLDPSDFELVEREEPMHSSEGPIKGYVTVKCKSNEVHKTYKAGHFSAWSAEFAQDLQRGVFD